ncbi:MAG: TrmH family RNA methyltransferase, partial [Bacteroidales bacterium]
AERFLTFQNVLSQRTRYISLLIENVFQTHNASAILRTAEALGIQDLYIYERKNHFNPNEEISMGAHKWLNIKKYNESEQSVSEVISQLKNKGYRIIATTLHDNAYDIEHIDLNKGKIVFLFGTEKEGLTTEIKSQADEFVKIPMFGFTESFNVSVSVGIVLYSVIRKLQKSNINYKLTEEERDNLMIEWLVKSIPAGEKILERILKKENR